MYAQGKRRGMRRIGSALWLFAGLLVFCCSAGYAQESPARKAETKDLGNGFFDHGVATPISTHRGIVATVDGQGHDVVLVWLFDHRGGYALLMINAETGKSQQFPTPFPPRGDSPYASILSSHNKYYTQFGSYFCEFDPVKRAFTFYRKTTPQMAMSMTEDDQGRIWSASYPNSGLVSFDPKTRKFKDYGSLYRQNWRQYPRSVAADDAGWIYFGVGSTADQIIAFNPKTGKATAMIPEAQRVHGSGVVYRDLNGRVYGRLPGHRRSEASWVEFYRGRETPAGSPERKGRKHIIAGSQGLFYRNFPDGKRIRSCDMVNRELVVEDPKTGQEKTVSFDYTSEGANLMAVAVAPDSTLCGGTAFPMRFFSYNPRTDAWINRAAYGQWNTVARQGDRFLVGGYTGGFLLSWNPSKPWVSTRRNNPESNPRFLTQCEPTINRPHRLLACPDGKTVVLAGTPGYGYTGGGLLIWNRETGQGTLLKDTDLISEQSTMSLVALPDGRLLGGTTTSPGTGGERKAKEAELYLLNMASKKIEWHRAVFPGTQGYTDLCPAPGGLVYGFADRRIFFVFDPRQRKVVYQKDTRDRFGPTTSQQGPRVFVPAPNGTVYVLFSRGIGRIDPSTYAIRLLARSPVRIGGGGDILDGRIYFCSGSHLYSYRVP